MSESCIVKTSCIYENIQYIEEGENLGKFITYPKDYEHKGEKIEITLNDGRSNKIPLNKLINMQNECKSDYEKYPILKDVKNILDNDYDSIKECIYTFPSISYKDITDYEFNGFEKIEQATLVSQGLWINNGIRRIELDFKGIKDFTTTARKKHDNEKKKIEVGIRLLKKDNNNLTHPISFEISKTREKIDEQLARYIIKFDTDKLGEHVQDRAHYSFYGEIKIQIRKDSVKYRDENTTYSFIFPFEIKMINPAIAQSHVRTDQVSIDFGTSSTCIARNKGKTLLSFNDNPKDILDYENMTALIIYNWKEIYKTWRNDNHTIPDMNRSKNKADEIKPNDHFDYGDKIKWELENAPSAKTMDAIITNLKALPEKLLNDSIKEEVTPFDNWKKKVYLTDNLGIDEENEETLNPIALYGYLIGRSLNLQIKDKVYTKYNLTMPVNFSKYKRDKILTSLEYGLKRSVPSILRDEVYVANNFEESVALLGAAYDLEYLEIKKNREATLFAVFDFGGGTLDFAFGLYREANDEKAVFEDEEEICDDVIEIFKTDGELIGGETLIEDLSLKLYKDNKNTMKKSKTPIYISNEKDYLKNFPANLMGKRHIDKVNLKSFNETFSRDFFINGKFSKTKIELFSIDNSEQFIEVDLEQLIENDANEFLEHKIQKLVENFKDILEKTFKDNIERIKEFGFETFDINEVKIIQAGNACKAKWVGVAFNKVFNNSQNITFIKNEEEGITPKNAVAKGALMLDGFKIYKWNQTDYRMPLDRYLWSKKSAKKQEPIFSQGDNSEKGWKLISRITNDTFTIYHSKTQKITGAKDPSLSFYTFEVPEKLKEESKNNIWVKPYDGELIDCVVGNKSGDNIDEKKIIIINLKTGNITNE